MTSTQPTATVHNLIPKEYRTLPTHQLIEKIVSDSDAAALQCFLTERRIFQHNAKNLLLPEYLNQLRETRISRELDDSEVPDIAYDRAYTKFISLPGTRYEIREDTKRPPVDCRKYYRAFLNAFHRQNQSTPLGEIESENVTATLLGRLIWRHYGLSLIDAQRNQDPAGRRYQWKTPQGTFNLRIPKSVTARKVREWLEQHFLQDDRQRSLDQKTIQKEIDGRFRFPKHSDPEKLPLVTDDRDKLIDAIDDLHHRLETAVIEEKLKNFEHLRPTLRRFGKEGLPALIKTCLRGLAAGTFNLRKTAEIFNIPLATMSDIAGTQWYEGENPRIPDLWQNVAIVISQNPRFHDAREEAGISQEELIKALTTYPTRKERKK
jgi:hypothetical protein